MHDAVTKCVSILIAQYNMKRVWLPTWETSMNANIGKSIHIGLIMIIKILSMYKWASRNNNKVTTKNKLIYDDWYSTNNHIISRIKYRQSLKKDETEKRKPSSNQNFQLNIKVSLIIELVNLNLVWLVQVLHRSWRILYKQNYIHNVLVHCILVFPILHQGHNRIVK